MQGLEDPIGGARLALQYGLDLVMPLAVASRIAGRRMTHVDRPTTVEMPDAQIDRVIRSVQSNQGELSGALRKELPILGEPGLWEAVVQAVQLAFEVGPRGEARL